MMRVDGLKTQLNDLFEREYQPAIDKLNAGLVKGIMGATGWLIPRVTSMGSNVSQVHRHNGIYLLAEADVPLIEYQEIPATETILRMMIPYTIAQRVVESSFMAERIMNPIVRDLTDRMKTARGYLDDSQRLMGDYAVAFQHPVVGENQYFLDSQSYAGFELRCYGNAVVIPGEYRYGE